MGENVKARAKSGHSMFWFLKRLKINGVKQVHLLRAYKIYVRTTMEYCVAPMVKMLSAGQLAKLESIQRRVTRLLLGLPIFGIVDMTYEQRMEKLGLKSLEERWDAQLLHTLRVGFFYRPV